MKSLTNCENHSSNPHQEACCSESRLWSWTLTNYSRDRENRNRIWCSFRKIRRISKCLQRSMQKFYIYSSLYHCRLKICAFTKSRPSKNSDWIWILERKKLYIFISVTYEPNYDGYLMQACCPGIIQFSSLLFFSCYSWHNISPLLTVERPFFVD